MDGEPRHADVIIIGGGIAGSSLAAVLDRGRVVLLEQEPQPGTHATGRSAAIFSATYGNPVVRGLTRATLPFLADPPNGFNEHPLLSPRGLLFIAREDQLSALETFVADADIAAFTRRLDADAVAAHLPILRPGYASAGVLEPDAREIDVHSLQAGYLKQARSRGVRIVTDARVTGIERRDGQWSVETAWGAFRAPVVVNAAGAWVNEVAALAGARPIAFEARRRTAILVDPPSGTDPAGWPMTVDMEEQFYLKPDAGRLLLSPADETLSDPCDSQPEEFDIAIAVDRVETATLLTVRRVHSSWAGLRTFAPDRSPVIGFDPVCEGFFWLAGQGGYGIQTCHASALAAAALIGGVALPSALADHDVSADDLSPARFSGDAVPGLAERHLAPGERYAG